MRIPTLHLNGTDPKTLLRDWRTVATQAMTLTNLLQSFPLNARDYYPQGMAAFTEAQADLTRLIDAARAIEKELTEVYGEVEDQVEARRGNR